MEHAWEQLFGCAPLPMSSCRCANCKHLQRQTVKDHEEQVTVTAQCVGEKERVGARQQGSEARLVTRWVMKRVISCNEIQGHFLPRRYFSSALIVPLGGASNLPLPAQVPRPGNVFCAERKSSQPWAVAGPVARPLLCTNHKSVEALQPPTRRRPLPHSTLASFDSSASTTASHPYFCSLAYIALLHGTRPARQATDSLLAQACSWHSAYSFIIGWAALSCSVVRMCAWTDT